MRASAITNDIFLNCLFMHWRWFLKLPKNYGYIQFCDSAGELDLGLKGGVSLRVCDLRLGGSGTMESLQSLVPSWVRERLGIWLGVEMTIEVMAFPPVGLTGLQEMSPKKGERACSRSSAKGGRGRKRRNPQPLSPVSR